jgi:hypothetical protein
VNSGLLCRTRGLTGAGRKRRLQKLLSRPEREIDTSDIPELTEKFWQNAARNPFLLLDQNGKRKKPATN